VILLKRFRLVMQGVRAYSGFGACFFGILWHWRFCMSNALDDWLSPDSPFPNSPGVPLMPSTRATRVIAYYLPQFHPIAENDEWWGAGFTEWTNVTKAAPLFPSHYQPQLPADFGFYDLRVADTREAQAALAQKHGIEGFCYWHYWFNGKRLLNRPLDEVLATGRPNFPFCVGWANESWTRRWTGEEAEILLQQTYSEKDDIRHAQWLAALFSDSRYIRVDGRPLFILYRAPSLPNAVRTLETFRSECVRLGVGEPYIVGRDTHNPGTDMRQFGCDITESSSPNLGVLPSAFVVPDRLRDLRRNARLGVWSSRLKVYDYEDACERMERARPKTHPFIHGFFVGWDNTARRGDKAIVLVNSTPETFAKGMRHVLAQLREQPDQHRIVFLNAWNEWAEGMYLEPNQRHGRGFLDALTRELDRARE
jgi:hypothetical protein